MMSKVEIYLLLEIMLICVIVYESNNWSAKSQEDVRKYLDERFQRLKETYQLLQQIQDQIDKITKDILHSDENIIIEICQKFKRS